MYKERTIDYVKSNLKDGFILNPNEKIVKAILKGINRCKGDCPCMGNSSYEKECPCSNFRENDICACRLYLPLVEDWDPQF